MEKYQCVRCTNKHDIEEQDICEYCAIEDLFEMTSKCFHCGAYTDECICSGGRDD